jgi:predicted transposase YdaD
MITTIMAYKFTHLTREEVEAMLGIELQETGFYKSSKAEGKAEGEQMGESKVILRLLNQRFAELPDDIQQQIAQLSIAQLDALTGALLSFEMPEDLIAWLNNHN